MKRDPSWAWRRNSAAFRPALRFSSKALLTSAGLSTGRPATSAIISPTRKPFSAAALPGSTLTTATPPLVLAGGRSEGETELGQFRRRTARRGGCGLFVGQAPEVDAHVLLGLVAPDLEGRGRAGRERRDLTRDIAGIIHGLTVDGPDHVTRLDAALAGRAVAPRLGTQARPRASRDRHASRSPSSAAQFGRPESPARSRPCLSAGRPRLGPSRLGSRKRRRHCRPTALRWQCSRR